MLTLLFILFPIVSGLALLALPKQYAKQVLLASALISLALTVYAVFDFTGAMSASYSMDNIWVEGLGVHFHIAMDGISLLMLLLSNLLMPFIGTTANGDQYERPALFYALMLIMQGAMNGVFVAMDMFLYYIFWELALIPAYILVLWWGKGETRRITFKFFLYTLFGSLFMLVAIIWLSWSGGNTSSDVHAIYNMSLSNSAQNYIFFAFMLAYAIKIPIFPMHTWQPDTYTTAPAPATMLLGGVMLKMGSYSIIRWVIPVVPHAVEEYGLMIAVFASVGVLYASLIAWTQRDLKRMFAWSSIAHVGLITAGLFTVSEIGLQGGLIQMLAHGINLIGLFYIAQILMRRYGNNSTEGLGGIRSIAPVFAGLYLVVLLASVALPLTNAFPGEWMLLNAIFSYHGWLTVLAGSGVIIGAVYMLQSYQRIMLENRMAKHMFSLR